MSPLINTLAAYWPRTDGVRSADNSTTRDLSKPTARTTSVGQASATATTDSMAATGSVSLGNELLSALTSLVGASSDSSASDTGSASGTGTGTDAAATQAGSGPSRKPERGGPPPGPPPGASASSGSGGAKTNAETSGSGTSRTLMDEIAKAIAAYATASTASSAKLTETGTSKVAAITA